MAISFRDPERAVAVGLDGLVIQTSDAGGSWKSVEAGTPLHLFDVAWTGAEWIAVGGMGVAAIGDPERESWKAQRLSTTDLAWHTAVVPLDEGVFVVGASQGIWRGGQWTPASGG
jgi:photosystem II stability/assembly factor-like uncharacterized protein